MNNILVITGPTASGKTALGVALAQDYNGEVVSADSMQIYRTMNIGTAKPTQEEMAGIPHHMLDIIDPNQDYSVAQYVEQATRCVDDIHCRGKLPILVGGTGLYIDHLIAGRTFAPYSGHWRSILQERVQKEGLPSLYKELATIDPQRAEKLAPRDEKRILRSLEVWYETGETLTVHDLRSQSLPPKYNALRLVLNYHDRTHLREHIAHRVEEMMDMGLLQEVEALMTQNLPPESTAMQAIGYKEFAHYLSGHWTLQQGVEEVKLRTGQYAKRQITWQRRFPQANWILWKKFPNLSEGRQKATKYIKAFGI